MASRNVVFLCVAKRLNECVTRDAVLLQSQSATHGHLVFYNVRNGTYVVKVGVFALLYVVNSFSFLTVNNAE